MTKPARWPHDAEIWKRDWQPYEDEICRPLADLLGIEFGVLHTGGGCHALHAGLENGDTMLVTDAEDILSPWGLRQRRWRNDREVLGYLVGYYAGEEYGYDALCYVRFRKARDAVALMIAVRCCINLAVAVKAGRAERGKEIAI